MQQHLHPVVLFGNRDVILVDCGYDSLQHLSGYRFLKGLTAILNWFQKGGGGICGFCWWKMKNTWRRLCAGFRKKQLHCRSGTRRRIRPGLRAFRYLWHHHSGYRYWRNQAIAGIKHNRRTAEAVRLCAWQFQGSENVPMGTIRRRGLFFSSGRKKGRLKKLFVFFCLFKTIYIYILGLFQERGQRPAPVFSLQSGCFYAIIYIILIYRDIIGYKGKTDLLL